LRLRRHLLWRRLGEWQEAGVWERLHKDLLDRLGEADRIDWERASLDSASIPAKGGHKTPWAHDPTVAGSYPFGRDSGWLPHERTETA
jgi:hypothetical protein